MPSIGLRHQAKGAPKCPIPAQIIAKGEFRGLARWLTSPFSAAAPDTGIFPVRPGDAVRRDEDPAGASDELDAILAAIADDVQRHASAAREGVLVDFAARATHARKHLSPNLLAATLAAIKEQRKAALTLIGRNAELERASRREAAIAAHGGKNTRKTGAKKPTGDTSGNAPQP
jgi:hypothetical protein